MTKSISNCFNLFGSYVPFYVHNAQSDTIRPSHQLVLQPTNHAIILSPSSKPLTTTLEMCGTASVAWRISAFLGNCSKLTKLDTYRRECMATMHWPGAADVQARPVAARCTQLCLVTPGGIHLPGHSRASLSSMERSCARVP